MQAVWGVFVLSVKSQPHRPNLISEGEHKEINVEKMNEKQRPEERQRERNKERKKEERKQED